MGNHFKAGKADSGGGGRACSWMGCAVLILGWQPGGILGSAGPNFVRAGPEENFLYTSIGGMTFDIADTAALALSGALDDVILHEMGHVLGIGTLWSGSAVGAGTGWQEVYVNDSGEYTGMKGLAAYNAEFGQAGAFVPVELGGGAGTANGHWNEGDGGGSATGIESLITGDDMQFELMTGWLNAPTFISSLTTQSLVDIGYTVIPEPSTWVLGLFLVGAVSRLRTRRRG